MLAPWFQHAAKGDFTGHLQKSGFSSLLQLMKVTQNCVGTDSKHNVIGVLALAQANAMHWDLVRLDYSLFLRHIMIGAFSHCLVVDENFDILWAASGIYGWGDYPSWVPAWRSSKIFGISLSKVGITWIIRWLPKP
ncbi:hypothetical protein QBC36DRAFT_131808 [Triangularia setosa]|uniref:Uncharacterized protein n=1 Tax=Triangularia setosa TaxID=2587417 RepID=A0AAN6W8X7_9PEZI|nr:hypothetical protein QBC36DRAFT_131808 [Podospora setosa]